MEIWYVEGMYMLKVISNENNFRASLKLCILYFPSSYDIITDHAHILFITEEKDAVRKIVKLGAVPPHARVSTFATAKSNNSSNYFTEDPEIPTCMFMSYRLRKLAFFQ